MLDKKSEAIGLLNEALKELESAKGSVTVAVQKLSRASLLLDEKIYMFGLRFNWEIKNMSFT